MRAQLQKKVDEWIQNLITAKKKEDDGVTRAFISGQISLLDQLSLELEHGTLFGIEFENEE